VEWESIEILIGSHLPAAFISLSQRLINLAEAGFPGIDR